MTVPFCRQLSRGCKGEDVRGHKIALHRAAPHKYPLEGPYSDLFGPIFEAGVKAFQAAHSITPSGKVGRRTHEALAASKMAGSSEYAFNIHSIDLCRRFCSQTHEQKVRHSIVAAAYYWYSHRLQIQYIQSRPFALGKPPFVPHGWDCSAFATACHFAGGAPDPNRLNYNHQGYTGTLLNSGRTVGSVSELEPGDLVFYGYTTRSSPAFPHGSPTHVAVYVGNGRVISNGHYPMGLYPVNYGQQINRYQHYKVA